MEKVFFFLFFFLFLFKILFHYFSFQNFILLFFFSVLSAPCCCWDSLRLTWHSSAKWGLGSPWFGVGVHEHLAEEWWAGLAA